MTMTKAIRQEFESVLGVAHKPRESYDRYNRRVARGAAKVAQSILAKLSPAAKDQLATIQGLVSVEQQATALSVAKVNGNSSAKKGHGIEPGSCEQHERIGDAY